MESWRLNRCLLLTAALGSAGCSLFARNPKIYVNQHGYSPDVEQVAVAESESPTPIAWSVVDAQGKTVKSGTSVPRGLDKESAESVHWLELGLGIGSGYRVQVGSDVSEPFDVSVSLYHQLKYDALAYFYHNRSGIDVALPWAKEFRWTRPAGHLSDAEATCAGHSCKYTLDVQGGWYDAGDFGKYVVNGGITLWTLLNLFERTQYLGTASADFADGKLSIPENANGVNDLLDEARWELEFLLRMQVPDGNALAGMVHHKIHDGSWSTLGRTPPTHAKNRALHPPSTAATLNLSAVAAQGARIFARVDPMFAAVCRAAAIRAWDAARAHPKIYASPMNNSGGGPYDDTDVSDEFYWAASELFITTGDARWFEELKASPHFAKAPETVEHERVRHWSAMTWQATASLGTISLAVVPSALDTGLRDAMRSAIRRSADVYLGLIDNSGFRVPMHAGKNGHYPWGSNSFVLNNSIVLALAADFTGDTRYRRGVFEAMNYLLGRNPLGFAYVSGYGERSLENPHHRFWAHQRCRRCPWPPPGAVAGGPNSRLADPTSNKRLSGCPVLKCYVDHVDAWGVNEVAINWNAPLAWVSAYLDESTKLAAIDR